MIEIPSSNRSQETYNFHVDYAQPSQIRKLEFVPTEDVYPTIEYIPTNIFSTFPNLENLRMPTSITELHPGDFNNATNLTILWMSKNKLKIIRNNVFSAIGKTNHTGDAAPPLPKLLSLSLRENVISEIEENSFSGLKSLKNLHLEFNRLTIIRGQIFAGLPSLEGLDLYSNQIETIEDGAFDLPQLN